MIHKVYMLTNNETGKSYVGMTVGTIENRIRQHVYHGSTVGAEIAKYGIECFTISILYRVRSRKRALDLEQQAIDRYQTHTPNGYNMSARGRRYPGRGGPKKGNRNSRRRPVVAMDDHRTVVHRFETIMCAANALGIHRNTIHRAIANPHYTSGGFHWKDADDDASHGG